MKITNLEGIGEILEKDFNNDDFNFIEIENKPIGCTNDKSNVVFRCAYHLWVLRGSNKLEDLLYYSNHVEQYTDNGYNLRGAYGPRLMFWVGADQLQEAININMNIDAEDDFVKPNGINQFVKVYEDLHDCEMNNSSMVIMDPAIDFEASNDIPDLISITFRNDGKLHAIMNYSHFNLNENHVNDIYLVEYLTDMMAMFLGINSGKIMINATCSEDYRSSVNKYNVYKINSEIEYRYEKIADYYKDIYDLFHFDRHLRNMINKYNLIHEEVSASRLVESLERKIINNLISKDAKNFAYTMLIGAIKIHIGNITEFENYIENILGKMSGRYKEEICNWLLYEGDIPHNIYTICQDAINV